MESPRPTLHEMAVDLILVTVLADCHVCLTGLLPDYQDAAPMKYLTCDVCGKLPSTRIVARKVTNPALNA